MTKTATRTSANAGVWIDHRHAQIVGLMPDGPVTTTILSNVEKHLARGGDSPMKGPYEAHQVPADDSRQRALTSKLNVYYDAVIAGLKDYGQLLVFGPGEAKGEIQARLLKMKQGARILAIESEGQLTDRQVVAKVRAYFGDAPLRGHSPL
jgi:hypothetical protein